MPQSGLDWQVGHVLHVFQQVGDVSSQVGVVP
jgi:hypothetical protein